MKLNTIPWANIEEWKEANNSIYKIIDLHKKRLNEIFELSLKIKSSYESIFPMMDSLCYETCLHCPDPCCISAKIWFDYKDLLFLNLSACENYKPENFGLALTLSQPISNLNNMCRYLNPQKGCTLSRIFRPFICTWYLCPAQKSNLRKKDKFITERFFSSLEFIRSARKQLEEEMISISGV